MRVRFTPEALLAVREKRVRWEQHRGKSPRLFVEELVAIVVKVRDGSDAERQQYAARGGRIIWRLSMRVVVEGFGFGHVGRAIP